MSEFKKGDIVIEEAENALKDAKFLNLGYRSSTSSIGDR